MAVHSLGSFNFIALDGEGGAGTPPSLVAERSLLVQRPGVDGTGVIKTGIKGEPFSMTSLVDATSVSAGHTLLALYAAAQNNALHVLVSADVNYFTAFDHKYVVLQVRPGPVRRVSSSVGGLSSPSVAIVTAVWTLLPVYIAPEPPEEP